MAFSGVRSSWLMLARNWDLWRAGAPSFLGERARPPSPDDQRPDDSGLAQERDRQQGPVTGPLHGLPKGIGWLVQDVRDLHRHTVQGRATHGGVSPEADPRLSEGLAQFLARLMGRPELELLGWSFEL